MRGAGRYFGLRVARPYANAAVAVEGPPGCGPMVVARWTVGDDEAPGRVLVAATTQEVHVGLEPGGQLTLAADCAAIVVE